MSKLFNSLAESPLTEIAQPSLVFTAITRAHLCGFYRGKNGGFTVSFSKIDAMSGLDTTEIEFQSAMEWAQMSADYG